MDIDVTQEQARKRGSRRSGKRPTLADVASEAGVSPMTASRVINNGNNVIEATRRRVEAAILRVGYVPNQAARALAAARQCRIALLYDNPSATWLSELLVGCLAEASATDAELLVERCDDHAEFGRLVRHLMSSRVDGVILPPPLCDNANLLIALQEAGVCAVQVASGEASQSTHAVGVDDCEAACAMTRYLVSRGHRRIGFIRGNPNQTASALRQIGYETALAEAGLALDPALLVEGDFSYRSGLEAAATLLSLTHRPTAIFASNDDMAAATISAAHRKGLDVPAELAVCGFDDTAMATMIWPRITTVRQPIDQMARTATQLVIEAIRATQNRLDWTPNHTRLPFSLVERESG